jgi:hypothetical protein
MAYDIMYWERVETTAGIDRVDGFALIEWGFIQAFEIESLF